MKAIIYTCCRRLLHPHKIKRLHFTNVYDKDLRGNIKQRIAMCAVVGETASCRNIKATSKHVSRVTNGSFKHVGTYNRGSETLIIEVSERTPV